MKAIVPTHRFIIQKNRISVPGRGLSAN